jgi:hypothetical protein
MKVPIAGGSPAPLVMSQHFLKGAIAVAGGNVSWITDVYGNVDAYNGKNAIVSITTSGSAVQVVAAIVDGSPNGYAVDAINFYWSDYNGTFALPVANPMATPVGFGSMLHDPAFAVGNGQLVQSESAAPGSGNVVLYRADGTMRTVLLSHPARPLGVDDKGAYVNDAGALERLALDGSGATLLATQAPRALALTTTTIYFTDGAAIYSLPR